MKPIVIAITNRPYELTCPSKIPQQICRLHLPIENMWTRTNTHELCQPHTSVALSGVESTRLCVGLDVHKGSIVVAVAYDDPVLHQLCDSDRGTIPNQLTRLIKLLDKIRDDHHATLYVVYEADPCGYGIYRYLHAHGYTCDVIAPSLMTTLPRVRVKTDRRDARKLASYARYGALTPI